MHELNFIPLSYRKNVPLPKVVIEPKLNQVYGGYYSEGIIFAVEDDYIDATLAHEFKHYLQHYYGCKGVIGDISEEDISYENYPFFIRKYYSSSWSEMDALLFESKIAPSPINHYWLKALVLPISLNTPIYI